MDNLYRKKEAHKVKKVMYEFAQEMGIQSRKVKESKKNAKGTS